MTINTKNNINSSKFSTFSRWCALLLLAVLGVQGVADAQDTYPNKSLRLLVPYPPGGVTDYASRTIAERLGRELGQSVIVENKAGAASTIASNITARATPDGYTAYAAPVSIVINPVLQGKVEYDPYKDFQPISMMLTSPFVLHANKDFKAGESKDPITKHFKLNALPCRVKRVKTSSSNKTAPPSPNCVRNDQNPSTPVPAWLRITMASWL